ADRKISKRIGVFFTAMKVFGERALAILRRVLQALVQHDAIFVRSVHPLPVEWHDGVRSIADEANLIPIEPRRAANRHQRTGWIIAEIFKQGWHKRHGIRKFFPEAPANIRIGLRRVATSG